MILDLEKLWQILNILSNKQDELCEQDIYVSLLGNNSMYSSPSFESFLEYYSFKIDKENIVVFNQDDIPYENYNNNDFSYVPVCLLSFSAENLEEWIDNEIQDQLNHQKLEKSAEKERIEQEIKQLQKRLNNL